MLLSPMVNLRVVKASSTEQFSITFVCSFIMLRVLLACILFGLLASNTEQFSRRRVRLAKNCPYAQTSSVEKNTRSLFQKMSLWLLFSIDLNMEIGIENL